MLRRVKRKIRKAVYLADMGMHSVAENGLKETLKRLKKIEDQNKKDIGLDKTLHIVPDEVLEKQRERKFENPVRFSIITPLYNTPEKFLEEMIQSVQNQTYSNWELCLADGSDPEHRYVEEFCEAAAEQDSRIIYHKLEENRGISENTNQCIKISTGDYIGLLDHDDILHPSALYEMMKRIEKTGADFLYTDEAKFEDNIQKIKAFTFKTGFGKDDLRSHNYICHFNVFSKELLVKAGGLYKQEFDGSQDHDMVLRLTENADRIEYIPKVLYYWRLHENSVSMGVEAKPYAVDAAIRAVKAQLQRAGEYGDVESNLPYLTLYRSRYRINAETLVSIIVYNVDSAARLKKCIKKIARNTSYKKIEIIILGNEKIFSEARMKDEITGIHVKLAEVQDEKSRGENWNYALKYATGDYVVLMDANIQPVSKDWVKEMMMYAQRKDVFAVGSKIYYKDDIICSGGAVLDARSAHGIKIICRGMDRDQPGYEAMLHHVRNATVVWGACVMMQRDKLKALGDFTETLRGYEDIDICLKARAKGLKNVWTCFAEFYYNGRKKKDEYDSADYEAFRKQWETCLKEPDIYYHPYWKKLNIV